MLNQRLCGRPQMAPRSLTHLGLVGHMDSAPWKGLVVAHGSLGGSGSVDILGSALWTDSQGP